MILPDVVLSLPFLFLLVMLSFVVQNYVQQTIKRYHREENIRKLTGGQLAEIMLHAHDIHDVKITTGKSGFVSDYYDPKHKKVHLSSDVYNRASVSSLAIAAHEVGHAIQHKKLYGPMKLRNILYPICSFSSRLGTMLLFAGFIIQVGEILTFGIYFYAISIVFTILNLPVEFDASQRAKKWLYSQGYVQQSEYRKVNKLLNAAAMTYVMAALIAIIQLLRIIAINRNQ